MRGHAVRRGTAIVLGAALLLGVGLSPEVATASGGGGCGRAVTDDDGTRIGISNFCFDPTIFRVQPGETVTWVNKDSFPHTVLGANALWGGFDSIRRDGGEVSYRFVHPGVYPYVCTIHVGMVGAVVVGDGVPDEAAYATTTNAGPVTRVKTPRVEPGAALVHEVVPVTASGRSWPTEVWWVLGLCVLVVVAIATSRRRRAQGTLTH